MQHSAMGKAFGPKPALLGQFQAKAKIPGLRGRKFRHPPEPHGLNFDFASRAAP